MRLRTLRLHNYRRYRDLELEFPDGVIAICGANGSGKSTLLEAVTWCLFGHEAARTGKDLIRHARAAPADETVVRLEFELDGDAYVVTRRMRGKTLQGDVGVECNGTLLVAPGPNSTDQGGAYLAKLLGMDRDAFHATIVAKQGDVSALSDRTAGARKRLVLGMLGVERLDHAIRLVRSDKREATIRLEEVRRSLGREDELRRRLTLLEEQLAESQAVLDRWQAEAGRAQARSAELTATADALEERRARHRDLRSRLEGLQRGLSALQAQRTRVGADLQLLTQKANELEQLEAQTGRYTAFEERWRRFEEERVQVEERRRLESDLHRLGEEAARWGQIAGANGRPPEPAPVEALRERLESLRTRVATTDARLAQLREEQRRHQAEAAEEQDRWRGLLELGPDAPCPTCERPLGDALPDLAHQAARHQDHVRARLAAVRTEIEATSDEASRLRRELADGQERLRTEERMLVAARVAHERGRLAAVELDRVGAQRVLVERSLAQAPVLVVDPAEEGRMSAEREERDRWRERVVRLREALLRSTKLREELATLAAEDERTRTDIMDLSRHLGALEYQDGSAEAARQQANAADRTRQDAEREVARLRERCDNLAQGRDAARRDVEHLEGLQTQRAQLEATVRVAERLAADHGDRGLFPEFKNHLIARIRPALARSAAALVGEMTSGRYTDLELDEEYEVQLFDGGKAWPLARFSGGEADVVNLALRLAVSELVASVRGRSRLRFVALDEVLANQDEGRRRAVLHALQGLGAHFRQVFLVTHWDEVRDGVDHVIRALPQEDGSSRVWASWDEKV